MDAPALILLDGPLGSELERRGVPLPLPLWTAAAVADDPEAVLDVHRTWGAAGAQVHTAATFRTTARALAASPWAARWQELAARAVALAREGGNGGLVAGSLAPLEDCYHPERTPPDETLAREHGALARALAEAGADLLLVETMPTLRELIAATRAAVATGRVVWSALTLGPRGDFFDAGQVREAAARVAAEGAEAFLVNCSPAERITPLLARLAGSAGAPPRIGAYGNTIFGGPIDWTPERYAEEAQRWVAAGASIVGGCCGTTPAHLVAVAASLR